MDESSNYCDCGSEIKSVLDVAKITNMVLTGDGEGRNLFTQRRVK